LKVLDYQDAQLAELDRRDAEAARALPSAVGQDLLECLLLLARAHGRTLTADAALAGLPVEGNTLPPSLFERAAQRAGLSARIVRQPWRTLNPQLLPAVLLLEGDRACLLAAVDAATGVAKVVYPELGEAQVEVGFRAVELLCGDGEDLALGSGDEAAPGIGEALRVGEVGSRSGGRVDLLHRGTGAAAGAAVDRSAIARGQGQGHDGKQRQATHG